MKEILKKLKSQKGATGTDVLIAAAMIVLAVGIVSMLYVNTSIQSRNITRTSGATRIATNLIENIDAISYEDFLKVLNGHNEIKVDENTDTTVFDTRIPIGYDVTINASPVYGDYNGDASKEFDLVRAVEVIVKYKVGKTTESINFSTVKKRELIGECNAPATADLRTGGFLQTGMNYYPVKYISTINAYLKTTEDDPEWYNYTNKEWATIVISRRNEDELFDLNGKFVGEINVATDNTAYTQKAVWVPRYFTSTSSSNKNVLFAYGTSNDRAIKYEELVANDGTTKYYYYKAVNIETGTGKNWNSVGSYFSDTQTGKWTLVNADNTLKTTDAFVPALNGSQYGPCNMH